VSSTQPTTGDLLTWTGTQWVPTKPVSFGTGCEPGSYVTGLNADGTLQCYVAKGFQKVTAGLYFSCGLVSDGSVRCWGYGSNSSLGNKSTLNQFKPVAVKTATGVLANAIDISSGYYHSCAVVGATPTDTQGQVWCWGLGTNGQLGDGTVVTKAYAVQVTGITTATQVSAGYLHSCARLANGTAQCWGNNAESRLGNGGTTQSAVPVTVVASGTAGISDISQISAGGRHTCAVRATGGGTAWCWGYNGYGQLGDNTTTNRQYPTQVNTITTGVTKVSAGFHFHYDGTSSYPTDSSCAIVSGEVWCWGRNNYGQLGDNTSAQKNLPVKVQLETGGFLAGASVIETAGGHTCAVANPTSTTYCWGHNNLRQSATDGTTTDKLRAVVLLDAAGSDPLINSVSIGLSDYYTNTFTLVVTQDPSASTGTAFAMGYNGYGNLGDGTTTNTSGPPIYVTAP
jgi:alpha-tubulin suppressor-like RCC1 family protein